jgi:hypothetical protein
MEKDAQWSDDPLLSVHILGTTIVRNLNTSRSSGKD